MLKSSLIKTVIARLSPMCAGGTWQTPEMALAAAVIEQGYVDLRGAFACGQDPNHEFELQKLAPWMRVLGLEPNQFHEAMLRAFSHSQDLREGR